MKPALKLNPIITGSLIFALVLAFSCTKEHSKNNSDAQQEEFASQASSQADAESEFIFNDVFDNVIGVNDDVGMAGVGVFGRVNNTGSGSNTSARENGCITVSVTHPNSPDIFPVKIVIDFGSGCPGRDGRVRTGKIITTYTNRLIYPGSKATTTFENYHVDSIKVEGTHIITNQGVVITSPNLSITHAWHVAIEGAKLSKPNGNYCEWNSVKDITQIEGFSTPLIPLDDIYKIVGSSSGKTKRGDFLYAWKAETLEPLIKKFSCRWIVKGVLKVVRLNLSTTSQWIALINYGNGDCDNKAVVTINGVPHEITLP